MFVSKSAASGKSLTCQLLLFAKDSIRNDEKSFVVIVSPLTSLMKDQVNFLKKRNIKAIVMDTECKTSMLQEESNRFVFGSP